MNDFVSITNIAHLIQLAVAPVFLLAAIAGFLAVMSGRLGRIIDRSRAIHSLTNQTLSKDDNRLYSRELSLVRKRTTIIHRSIALCTSSALLICLLIVSLFIGGSLNLDLGIFIISCFVLAMVLLIFALILFLLEIKLATQQLETW